MKASRSTLLLLSAIAVSTVFAQAPNPAGPPPVPPPPPNPGMSQPRPMPQQPMMPGMSPAARNFRYMAPVGMQARYVYMVITTNKDELKLTADQLKQVEAAREADDKVTQDRGTLKMTTRESLQTLADAETPDMAKIEAKIRDLKKMEGDDMLADYKLAAQYKKVLTADQRDKIKTLGPRFDQMMPTPVRPGMPGMPGNPNMPNRPMPGMGGMPNMPSMNPPAMATPMPVPPAPPVPAPAPPQP